MLREEDCLASEASRRGNARVKQRDMASERKYNSWIMEKHWDSSDGFGCHVPSFIIRWSHLCRCQTSECLSASRRPLRQLTNEQREQTQTGRPTVALYVIYILCASILLCSSNWIHKTYGLHTATNNSSGGGSEREKNSEYSRLI